MEIFGLRLVGRITWTGMIFLIVLGLIWACGTQVDEPGPRTTPTLPSSTTDSGLIETEEPTPPTAAVVTAEASPVSTVTPMPIPSITPVATPYSTPTPTVTPTTTPISVPMPPCNPDQIAIGDPHPYKESGLASLWNQFPWAYCELVKRPWITEGGDDPSYEEPSVLLYLSEMLIPDETTAIKVVSLPFLDTIEWGDADAMQFLFDLSWEDPAGLLELLSHDSLSTGDSRPIQLVYLDIKNPGAAAEIAGLSWVMDGLHEF